MIELSNHIVLSEIEVIHAAKKPMNIKSDDYASLVFDLAHDIKEDHLAVLLGLKKKETIVASYVFHFKIKNMELFYSLNEEEVVVFDVHFLQNVVGISYSTLRGILFSASGNATKLILPVVNPIEIIRNSAKFSNS